VTVCNPPYRITNNGAASVSAPVRFLNKAAEFSDVCVFLVPYSSRTFANLATVDGNLHLVAEKEFPKTRFCKCSGEERKYVAVNVVAQVWERRECKRVIVSVPRSITLEDTTSFGFEFVPYTFWVKPESVALKDDPIVFTYKLGSINTVWQVRVSIQSDRGKELLRQLRSKTRLTAPSWKAMRIINETIFTRMWSALKPRVRSYARRTANGNNPNVPTYIAVHLMRG